MIKNYLKHFDWLMFSSVILLACFGLLELYSIALGQASNFNNFNKQVLFVIMGIVLLFFFSFIDWRWLKSLRFYLYLLAILLLIGVLIFGQDIRGTRGWFSVGDFNFQPVELVKIILIIFLSGFFTDLATKVKKIKHLLLSALSTIILTILVMFQPDFGAAVILLAIWLLTVIVSGFKRRYFVILSLVSLVIAIFSWTSFFEDYQKNRILAFINPGADTQGTTYNISQAIIAIGSGGVIGQGIGFGTQSQLKFLPEAHTDFIFAVIAEELGFLGVILVLSFFAIFFIRCLQSLKFIHHDYGTYFIVSALGLIFIQMFINIGMNIGIMPVVGLALPFMSYGGSSIISLFILVGMIQNIIIKSKINYF